MSRHTENDLGAALGGLLPIPVAITLVPVRGEMASANVALVLMATVVLAALIGGRRGGLLAAVTATLSFDFFHTRPYQSLTIDSADDVETAAILLLTGLVVGSLTGRRWAAQDRAAVRSDEIRRLHRVAELVASGAQPAEVLFASERELTALLGLRGCDFAAGRGDPDTPRIERGGSLAGGARRFVRGEFALPGPTVLLPVLHRGQQVGAFVLTPDPDTGVSLEQRVVAVAIADQAGSALTPPVGEDCSA